MVLTGCGSCRLGDQPPGKDDRDSNLEFPHPESMGNNVFKIREDEGILCVLSRGVRCRACTG